MSTRNFLRRFEVESGKTPSEYLLQVRTELCCSLLAQSKVNERARLKRSTRQSFHISFMPH